MEWYKYFGGLRAGIFVANFVPHFVNGISGNKFPAPFVKPRGKELSSLLINVVWALVNLIIGFVLFRVGILSCNNYLPLIIFFPGITFISLWLSKHFAEKEKE